mgnify:CR=1 FL=1
MTYSTIEQEILQLLNQHRTKTNLLPLHFDQTVQLAALEHSTQMAQQKIPFGHAGFEERANQLLQQLKANGIAENVALGQSSATEVVQGWLASPGHAKNIVGDYNLTGISVVQNDKQENVFTQIFVKSTAVPAEMPTTTPSKENTPNLNYQLLELLNQHRQAQHLSSLQLNPHLQSLATTHAQQMAKKQTAFGHNGFEQRAKKVIELTKATAVAENIALGNADAALIWKTWVESPPHLQNMQGEFDWTGIGVAKNEENQYFYCQLFAKK